MAGPHAQYKLGLCLLSAGRPREAEKALDSAVRFDPNFGPAHTALGAVFLHDGKTADAKREFNSALQLTPDSVEARFNLGRTLIAEKNFSEAMWELLQVLRSDPKYVPAIGALSFVLDQMGDNAAAVSYLEAAVRSVPGNSDLYVFLGSHQYREDKYPEASASYRKAIQLKPGSDQAHYGLGLALLMENTKQAAAEFATALRLNRRNALAHLELGKLAVQENDLKTAAVHLTEAVRLQPSSVEARVELAELYELQNKRAEAEKILRTAVRLEPQNPAALNRLGRLLQAQGFTEEAKVLFEQVKALNEIYQRPAEAVSATDEGTNALNAGRLEDSVVAFRKALAVEPTAQRSYLLGKALLQEGKTREAIECFRTATQMRPSFLGAQLALVQALKGIRDPAADDEWRKAELLDTLLEPDAQVNQGTVEGAIDQYNSAVSLMQQGKTEAAAKVLQRAIKLDPNLVEAHHALGVLLVRRGDKAGAKREFSTILRLDPGNAEAHNNLGVILAQEGNFPEALEHILEVLRSNPNEVKAHINLSNVLISEGDNEAAVNELQAATNSIPQNALLLSQLGRAELLAGNNEGAIRSLREALALNPQLGSAHCRLGESLLANGGAAEARAEFNEALHFDSGNVDAHFQLGTMALQAGDKEEAVRYFQEAIRIKPEYVAAHVGLGHAYQQLTRLDAAEKEFRTAVGLNPDMPQALYALAVVLKKRGKNAEATARFEEFGKLQQHGDAKDLVTKSNTEGNEFRKQGRLDQAIASYKEALVANPFSADVAYNLGLVLIDGQGKLEEGIKALRLAIQLRPSFVLAQDALALALEKLGDPSAQDERRKADLLKRFVPPADDSAVPN